MSECHICFCEIKTFGIMEGCDVHVSDFCFRCLERWFSLEKSSNHCPICKRVVTKLYAIQEHKIQSNITPIGIGDRRHKGYCEEYGAERHNSVSPYTYTVGNNVSHPFRRNTVVKLSF